MEAGPAAPSHLAVLLVRSSKYFLYEYAHVLLSYCAQIARVLNLSTSNLSTAQVCTLSSGWRTAWPLRPTSPCCLYIAGNIFYTNMLTSSFLLRPGCAHLARMPNLSTPNLSTAQDGSGPLRSIPPRHVTCTEQEIFFIRI